MERTHKFNARAHGAVGRIEYPFNKEVPAQAPVLLAADGGYSYSRTGPYTLEGVLSFGAAHTQVAGTISRKNGGWTTLVSSTVEDVNILNVVTADRAVAQIVLDHPKEGYVPRVSFIGTQFVNLRIGGYLVQPIFDLDFCDLHNGEFPDKALIHDDRFHARVGEQYQAINNAKNIPAWSKKKAAPEWVQERYSWDAAKSRLTSNGSINCSLIRELRGEHPGYPFNNCVEIRGFGKVFLADLVVEQNSFELTMIRLELGCPVGGTVSLAVAKPNGTSFP